MKSMIAVSIAAVFAVSAGAAYASPKKAATVKLASAKTPTAIYCPVTGDKIASPKDAYQTEVYQGKIYYFCCAGCKPQFDKDPAKYIGKAAAAK